MRGRFLAIVMAVAVLALAAPAAAQHRGGHPPHYGHAYHGYPHYGYPHYSWSVGVGWGWGWGLGWGPGWGWWGPPYAYAPVVVGAQPSNLTVVDTDVEPEHARVFLNGDLIGVADDFDGYPDYLYLEPGRYTLEFRLQGYASAKEEIDAQGGRYVPINLKLERIPGEKAAPWYDRPQGMPVGRVFGPPKPAQGSAAKPGADATLRPETRGPGSQPAPAGAAAAWAALELRVSPANAAVYVDGEMVGTAQELARLERGLAVSAGTHTIEVVAPGHASRAVTVEVREGQRQQVVVDLESRTGQSE